MSQPTPHVEQGAFYNLPDELLIAILKYSPDLSSLWCLIHTSPRLSAVFEHYALEITEAIIASTVPPLTQQAVLAVLHARLDSFGFDGVEAITSIHNQPLPPSPRPEAIRSFVRLAHQVHLVAHDCLDHYLRRTMNMNFLELAEPRFYYKPLRSREPPWKKRPAGVPYQPEDAGPPSWLEEQRVILACWRCQHYFELCIAHEAGKLPWYPRDEPPRYLAVQYLAESYNGDFYLHELFHTVFLFFKESRGKHDNSIEPRRLPSPVAAHYDLSCYHLDGVGFQPEATTLRLRDANLGEKFVQLMSFDMKKSPLPRISSRAYHKFGLMIWDDKRMKALGLWPSDNTHPASTKFYFRWHSLLTDEECAAATATAELDVSPTSTSTSTTR